MGIAVLSITVRAIIDPLSGWDNVTRWDHLARLLFAQQSLAHYPPVTSQDFVFYGWCDGIPPLVSGLNFWLYLGVGEPAPTVTAIRVGAETFVAGIACFRLAQRWWGPAVGWPALAVLATSSLFIWATAIGQETGLLAASLAALTLLLEEHRTEPTASSGCWIGGVAGVGALSRDYGVAFLALAGVVMATTRSSRQTMGPFFLAAVLVAAPWYARNWLLTGNPLYPHELGGLFPSNSAHLEIMRGIAGHWGFTAGVYSPKEIPPTLIATAGSALLLGVVGLVKGGRRTWLGGLVLSMVAGLWWWALPFTAGGWNYASRVLAPAIVIASALAGWVALGVARFRAIIMVAVIFLATDAARRAWLLPLEPQAAPWPYTWSAWRNSKQELERLKTPQIWDILIAEARGQGILVDHPSYQVAVLAQGGRPIPWFSPQARPLLESTRPLPEVIAQLRTNGVRFITLFSGNPMTEHFKIVYPRLQELTTQHAPTVSAHRLQIYDLHLLGSVPLSPP